jgi:hypothetical protein
MTPDLNNNLTFMLMAGKVIFIFVTVINSSFYLSIAAVAAAVVAPVKKPYPKAQDEWLRGRVAWRRSFNCEAYRTSHCCS